MSEELQESLYSKIAGCYFAEAASIYISESLDNAMETWNRYFNPISINGKNDSLYEPSRSRINSIDDIASALTRLHESEHYRTIVSTPFGLFMFRVLHAMSHMIQYALLSMSDLNGNILSINGSLADWYKAKGYKLISGKLNSQKHIKIEHIEKAINESLHLYNGINKYLLSSGYNALETCTTLNNILRIIKRVHGFKHVPKIISRKTSTTELIIVSDMNILSLIEAQARFKELAVLIISNASEYVISKWESTRLHGIYVPVFNYLKDMLDKNLPLAMFVLDISLLGPVDPIFYEEDRVYFEDIHPVYRLRRTVEIIRKNNLTSINAYKNAKNIAEAIYAETGWLDPRVLSRRIHKKKFMDEAIYGRKYEHYNEFDIEEAMNLVGLIEENMLRQCQRALDLRSHDAISLAFGLYGKKGPEDGNIGNRIFHPIIEYYKDGIYSFEPDFDDKITEREHMRYFLFRHLAISLLCQSIISGSDRKISMLKKISKLIGKELDISSKKCGIEIPNQMYYEVEDIARHDLGVKIEQ